MSGSAPSGAPAPDLSDAHQTMLDAIGWSPRTFPSVVDSTRFDPAEAAALGGIGLALGLVSRPAERPSSPAL